MVLPSSRVTVLHTVNMRVAPNLSELKQNPTGITTQWYYTKNEPLSITVSFPADTRGAITWVFARSLLQEAMNDSAGNGDIVLAYAERVGNLFDRMIMHISSDDGAAILDASRTQLEDFLQETYQRVPQEKEEEVLDVDALIRKLLTL